MRSKTMNMSEGRPLKLLTQQPFGSLGMALTTYAGQNYGARHTDRVREGLRDAMLAMAVFSGAMFIVMQLLGPTIIRAFVSDAEVVALGGRALQLTSRFYVFLGTIYMTRGTLNGVGDALFSFINGFIEMLPAHGADPVFLCGRVVDLVDGSADLDNQRRCMHDALACLEQKNPGNGKAGAADLTCIMQCPALRYRSGPVIRPGCMMHKPQIRTNDPARLHDA